MSLELHDWRAMPADVVGPLLSAESVAYHQLGWDVSEAWKVLEPSRAAGRLPGFVASAEGRVRGWSCHLVHRGTLQVAMLVANRPDVTERLVDAVLESPEAGRSDTQCLFVRAAAPGLHAALAARHFDVASYAYRSATPPHLGGGRPVVRRWQTGDERAMKGLLSRAYAFEPGMRAFAPHGTDDEWSDYLHSLTGGTACGRFMPDVSFVVDGSSAGTLIAGIVVTDLGPSTAHVAQVVVDPTRQGHGLGAALLGAVGEEATRQGFARLTLLVSEQSRRARALYDRLGFDESDTFVSAVRSAALVDERRRRCRHEDTAIGGERRLAALQPGHRAPASQLGISQRGQ